VQLQDRSLVWNTDLLEACELDNLLTNAAITVHSAEARKVRRIYTPAQACYILL
jgi:succinate dehydrogenase/fumarate reductase flavoprotein subunit